MPHDHVHTPPDEWKAALRAQGYRLTPQREMVLRAVDHLGSHLGDTAAAAADQVHVGR